MRDAEAVREVIMRRVGVVGGFDAVTVTGAAVHWRRALRPDELAHLASSTGVQLALR